jgi:class 3 adenylate cyclase/tetratricopeptide (TPR) repeat protein
MRREDLEGERGVVASPPKQAGGVRPIHVPGAEGEVQVVAAEVVVQVDVRETVAERPEEHVRSVRLVRAAAEVCVPDVEVEPERRRRVEDRSQVLGTAEGAAEILDHQRDAESGGVVCEPGQRVGVPRADVVDREQPVERVGMNVDERDARRRELPASRQQILVRLLAQPLERRRDGQVVRRVPDGAEPELRQQPSDPIPVRRPSARRLEGQIDEVVALVGDRAQLLLDWAGGMVHQSELHGERRGLGARTADDIAPSLAARHNSPMPTCATCGAELPAKARFCASCGAAVEERPATEERKLATVLFADLVGSTELGEQDPERTRALLDRFYDAMAAEIEASGGTVEKFIGDAVMAAFGAPLAHEDHAERALHSALSMQRRLDELFGGELALRIGVNTGDVVVGRPREGSSFVTGDAVNVAQRLEAAAAPGEILVGERTVAAARGAFEFGDQTSIEAKGKTAAVDARRLVRALSLMRPRGVGGLRSAFVGRESELGLLQATYRRAVDQGEPHLVTIMGDAGVGKTRLVRELWEWLAMQSPEPVRRTGRCLSYGQGITYWALGEILKEHLGILESDPPETVRKRLESREILGLALGLDIGGDLHPLAARDRLHEAWVDFLEELAAEAPAIVLIEDLHWAEDELLDLLERVLRDVRGPLFLLGTARPELLDRRPAWGGGRRNTSLLWLEPLSEGEAGRMLDEVLAADLAPEFREMIVERAEGNPFFVEELLASLLDRGILARRDGGWHAAELPEDFEVPDSVQAVIASRIDLLDTREKTGLQAAAVIGRVFWPAPVRELVDEEPDWNLLEDKDFIRRRSGSSMEGEQEYAIKHALTREVVYASVPKAKRARLHAAAAAWLEGRGDEQDGVASLLAHHYAEAVRPEDADLAWAQEDEQYSRLQEKAVRWLLRAAELATRRYEIDEALALLDQALPLESDDEARGEIWHQIGRANALKFDGEAFSAAMEKAIELSRDRERIADLYSDLAVETAGRAGMWQRRPSDELVEGWIGQALELAEPDSEARAKALLAKTFWGTEDEAAAAVEASALADRLHDPELRVLAWMGRSGVAFRRRDYDEALTWAQRSFELIGDVPDPELRADVYSQALLPSLAWGRFRETRRLAAAHDEISSKLTPHHRVHGIAVLLEVEEAIGAWERITKLEPRAKADVEANLATPCIRNARSLLLCALARLDAGDDDGARELERRADEIRLEGYGLTLDAPKARLALLRGDLETVERLVAGALPSMHFVYFAGLSTVLDGLAALRLRDRVEEEAMPLLKPGTYLEPFALRALGIVREDEELVRQALARFDEMHLDWHAKQTRAIQAA